MRDLAGQVADARVAVEGGVPDPQGTTGGVQRFSAPPAHVVSLVGAAADVLLKGEILLAVEHVQRAHRRIRVGPMEHHAFGDLQAAAQRHRVRGVPFGCEHRRDHFGLVADQRDVERISGDAIGIACDLRQALERGMRAALHLRPDPR